MINVSSDNLEGRIKFFEEQNHPELYDMDYVKTFKTSKEAIDYFLRNQVSYEDPFSKREITMLLLSNFPKALKQEAVQNIYQTLIAYKNKLSSQSLPKCTFPSPEEIEEEYDRWLATPKGEYSGPFNFPK